MSALLVCTDCGQVHPSDCARACRRFADGIGFRANLPEAPIRQTRTEAEADWCQAMRVPDQTSPEPDLFAGAYPDPPKPGEPEPKESYGVRLTRRQKADVERGVHPLTGGRLREGDETCGTCRHRIYNGGHAKDYPKCELGPRTGGPRTDIRSWWPACTRWEAL